MNIYQRLNEIRKEVAYIRKDKKVGEKYMATTHDAVTAELRESLILNGVIIVPRLESAQTIITGMTTSRGIPIIRYEARYCISFVNCDEPSESVPVIIEAHALDEGDKAPGKAISYATKYAMLKLFSIETGDDEESRITPKVKVTKGAEMVADIIDAKIGPASGALDSQDADTKAWLEEMSGNIMNLFKRGDVSGAVAECAESMSKLDDPEKKIALWKLLPSVARTAIKEAQEAAKSPA